MLEKFAVTLTDGDLSLTKCTFISIYINKDENVHRFALSAIRGELWREREIVMGYYIGIILKNLVKKA